MRNVKNLKIYKSMLLLGTSTIVLMTSCGKTKEVYYDEPYIEDSYAEDTIVNEDISNYSVHDEKEDAFVEENIEPKIQIVDEFGNDVTEEYINKKPNEIEYLKSDDIENNTLSNNAESNDEVIINYFKDKKTELNNTGDLKEYKEKVINFFITTTDFIFYDGEIYGIHYDELKEETKKTILGDFAEMDEIISSRYPNYKEDALAKYDKAANWTVESYNNVVNYIKSGLSDESLKNIDILKESLKNTGSDLANTTESIYNDQKVKVKSWYETFRNNH